MPTYTDTIRAADNTRCHSAGANVLDWAPIAPKSRASERYRRIALTGLGTATARGINIATMLASVPLCLKHLGPQHCGLWLMIIPLITVSGLVDLGIGNGLLNAVATAHGRDDRRLARQLIASAAAMLCFTATVLLILYLCYQSFVDWTAVFNVTDTAVAAEVQPTLLGLALCVIASIPLSPVARVQLAYQQGYLNSIWESVGNLSALAWLVLGVYLAAGLPWLVLALAGAPLLSATLNMCHLFGWHSPWLRPRLSDIRWPLAVSMLRSGGLFFVLQLAILLLQVSDTLIVTQLWGPERVTEFAVPQRLFALPMMALAVVLTPLWPAYTESLARGDVRWVRSALMRSLVLSLAVSGTAAFVLVGWGGAILHYWVGPTVAVSNSLLWAMGVGLVLQAVGSSLSTLLNAARIIGLQIVLGVLLMLGKLGLSLSLAESLGIAGIAWGTTIAYGVIMLAPYGVILPQLLARLDTETHRNRQCQG